MKEKKVVFNNRFPFEPVKVSEEEKGKRNGDEVKKFITVTRDKCDESEKKQEDPKHE